MEPLVAVIIPCYNYGEYLEECVESVLGSTYTNIEIIIVNDGSTDPYTLDILRKMELKPNLKIVHRPNGGLSAARNTGIRSTDAPYVLLLDADDLIESSFIQKGVRLLEENKEYAFAYPLVKLFGQVDKVWETLPYNFFYLKFRNVIPATIILKRHAWEVVGGYDEGMREGYEDWEFVLRLGRSGFRGLHINEILFYYRKHAGSMLEGSKKKHFYLFKQIRFKHPDLYRLFYVQFSMFILMEISRRMKKFFSYLLLVK